MLKGLSLDLKYFMLKFGLSRLMVKETVFNKVSMITVIPNFTMDIMNHVINLYSIYVYTGNFFLPQVFSFRFKYRGRMKLRILVIEKTFISKKMVNFFFKDFFYLAFKKKIFLSIFEKFNLKSNYGIFAKNFYLNFSFKWLLLLGLYNFVLIETGRPINTPLVNFIFIMRPLNVYSVKRKEIFRYTLLLIVYYYNFFSNN